MEDEGEHRGALEQAVSHLLRPLFRVLLRQGMSFGAFEELARRAYVDVALHEFGIPGKKPSISRASILSGLTRKEVQRLASQPATRGPEGGERYNRAARVLSGWVRDADFADSASRPRALQLDGPGGFAALVRKHSGDVPARAVLDELLRVGAVVQRGDGRIELRSRGYVPQRGVAEKLHILGSDVADLVSTIDHNLQHGDADPRFQRKVMYQGVPLRALPAFRKLAAALAQVLLERLDHWLAAQVAQDAGSAASAPGVRIGMGVYCFEEGLDASTPTSGKRT